MSQTCRLRYAAAPSPLWSSALKSPAPCPPWSLLLDLLQPCPPWSLFSNLLHLVFGCLLAPSCLRSQPTIPLPHFYFSLARFCLTGPAISATRCASASQSATSFTRSGATHFPSSSPYSLSAPQPPKLQYCRASATRRTSIGRSATNFTRSPRSSFSLLLTMFTFSPTSNKALVLLRSNS